MLPLRDTIRSDRFPIVNVSIIGINVLVFVVEFTMAPRTFEAFLTEFGLVPARLGLLSPGSWLTVGTSMFLHGSWFHLISNMWTLFIFGDNVEDRMGHFRYAVFYLFVGTIAGLTHALFAAGSQVPTVGASGAIAGVLGAYFLLFPRGRVLTLVPLFILPSLIEIPAFVYLGFWFLSQLSSGLLSLGTVAGSGFSGIAWWAHIGGFIGGLALVNLFARRRQRWATYYDDADSWSGGS